RDASRFFFFQDFRGVVVDDDHGSGAHDIFLGAVADLVIPGVNNGGRQERKEGCEDQLRCAFYHRNDFCSARRLFPSQIVARQAVTSPNFRYSSPVNWSELQRPNQVPFSMGISRTALLGKSPLAVPRSSTRNFSGSWTWPCTRHWISN